MRLSSHEDMWGYMRPLGAGVCMRLAVIRIYGSVYMRLYMRVYMRLCGGVHEAVWGCS